MQVLVEDITATLREKQGSLLAVEVPPYFDRYVSAEIGRVSR